MKIGVLLLLLAASFVFLGFAFSFLPLTILLLWVGWSFAGVGFAYVLNTPESLCKDTNGKRKRWTLLFLAPFLGIITVIRAIMRLLGEDAWNEVSDGLYVGRIIGHLNVLPEGIRSVVDMTSEFLESKSIQDRFVYYCLPTLDGAAPPKQKLIELIQELKNAPGPIYVHCAAGHGRSALVAGLLLVARGDATDIDAAETLMKMSRPGIRIAGPQKRLAREILSEDML